MDILKKIRLIFQNFPKTVIHDLNKLCFQNYCTSLIKVVNEKEQLKLHQSLLGVKGGGGGQNQPSEQPSLQHLAVSLKINICRPNFS